MCPFLFGPFDRVEPVPIPEPKLIPTSMEFCMMVGTEGDRPLIPGSHPHTAPTNNHQMVGLRTLATNYTAKAPDMVQIMFRGPTGWALGIAGHRRFLFLSGPCSPLVLSDRRTKASRPTT